MLRERLRLLSAAPVGHWQATVAFQVREDSILLMITLRALSVKVDENSNRAARSMNREALATHPTQMSQPR